MTSNALQRILIEIKNHPREREGFKKSDCENLSTNEESIAKEALMKSVCEGDLRCDAPLHWLLKGTYTQELAHAFDLCEIHDHGSIFLPYVLHVETGISSWTQKMKEGIRLGDPTWEMRRSALLQLREIDTNEGFNDFCWELIKHDPVPSMQKAPPHNIL